MCLCLKNAFYPKPLSHLWLNWTKSEKNRNWFGIADHGLCITHVYNTLLTTRAGSQGVNSQRADGKDGDVNGYRDLLHPLSPRHHPHHPHPLPPPPSPYTLSIPVAAEISSIILLT